MYRYFYGNDIAPIFSRVGPEGEVGGLGVSSAQLGKSSSAKLGKSDHTVEFWRMLGSKSGIYGSGSLLGLVTYCGRSTNGARGGVR